MSENCREIYERYLQSDHWAGLRLTLFNQRGKRCSVCLSQEKIVAHHMVYREPLNSCTTDDLMPLCEICHNTLHLDRRLNATSAALPNNQARHELVCHRLRKRMVKPKKRKKKNRQWNKRNRNPWANSPAREYRKPRKFMNYATYQATMETTPIWERPIIHRSAESL